MCGYAFVTSLYEKENLSFDRKHLFEGEHDEANKAFVFDLTDEPEVDE